MTTGIAETNGAVATGDADATVVLAAGVAGTDTDNAGVSATGPAEVIAGANVSWVPDGTVSVLEAAHGGYAERLGGAGTHCATKLGQLTGKETRHVVLGHLQRGGVPTAFDRTLATRFGGKAMQLLLHGMYGKMVANHPPDIVPIPLGEVVGKTKTVPLDYDLLLTARGLGVSFGD